MDQNVEADRTLVRRLEALANLNRLLVLRALRTPKALGEVTVRDEGNGAPIARQSVRRHLDALIDADLVRTREAEREYGDTNEFVLNHQRLFAISEDLRKLARLRPTLELDSETVMGGASAPADHQRPCLLLVSGLDPGAWFDLRPKGGAQHWTIGRRRDVEVSLDFDSTVSAENALIHWVGDRHVIEDLPGSRNGTRVNGQVVEGAPRPLAHGDLIAVGRCLLLYWR